MYAKTAAAPDFSKMTDAELLAMAKKPSGIADFFKSIPRGALSGLSSAASALGAATQAEMGQMDEVRPTAEQGLKAMEQNITGPLPTPQGTGGKYGRAVGETLGNPASYVGPGGLPMKLLTGATSAAGGEAGRQAMEGQKGELAAQLAGALAGAAAPGAIAKGITPFAASAPRQRAVDILRDEGVTSLTAGQRTGNKNLQYAESILGDGPGSGAGASRIQHEGQEQFTNAALRRAGTEGAATPEVLAENNRRLTQSFNDLSSRNTLTPDNQFVTDLTQAVRDYRNVPNSQQRAVVQGYIDDIVDHINTGSMPGPQYQEMRSRLSRQAKSLSQSDPTLSDALRDMRNALDNAMERSIPAGSPDAAAWRQARLQYGAQKDIEKAASRAGEVTAEGQITPANLRNVVSANNRGAYARGEGQFADLARSGAAAMSPLPNSGTAQREIIRSLATVLGGGAGAGIAGVPGAIAGAAGATAVPAIVGRLMMSRPGQAYLGNQVLAGFPSSEGSSMRALVNALMQQGTHHAP
jgi:hypothetical protein